MTDIPFESEDHTNGEKIAMEPGVALDYIQDDQNVALLNIAHKGLRIKSDEGAAFRCMGLFYNIDDAKEHYSKLPDEGYETIVHKCRAWKLIPEKPPVDSAAEVAQMKSILKYDEKQRALKFEEFEKRRKEKADFKNPHKQKVRDSGWSHQDTRMKKRKAHRVTDQNYACVGLKKAADGARLVMFLAAFENDSECRRYLRDTAAFEHKHTDLFCVRMYEWVLVDDAYKCENWGFRHKKLDDFFQTRYKDNIEAASYMKQLEEEKEKTKMKGTKGLLTDSK